MKTSKRLISVTGMRDIVQRRIPVKSQPLARVYSAFGSCEETLRATGPGVVLGLADHARVVPGSEIIAVARRES